MNYKLAYCFIGVTNILLLINATNLERLMFIMGASWIGFIWASKNLGRKTEEAKTK